MSPSCSIHRPATAFLSIALSPLCVDGEVKVEQREGRPVLCIEQASLACCWCRLPPFHGYDRMPDLSSDAVAQRAWAPIKQFFESESIHEPVLPAKQFQHLCDGLRERHIGAHRRLFDRVQLRMRSLNQSQPSRMRD